METAERRCGADRRKGYTPFRETIDGKVWKAWLEPGHPRAAEQIGVQAIMKGNITKRGENSWRLKFDAGRDATGKRKTQYRHVSRHQARGAGQAGGVDRSRSGRGASSSQAR